VAGGLEELLGRVAGRFPRVEPRWRTRAFVLGLLADLPRKNCWTIAEHAGQVSPDGTGAPAGPGGVDEDGVGDDLRARGGRAPRRPAGRAGGRRGRRPQEGHPHGRVQRQYTGTAGKVDNAQVAVYLAYATTAGHGVIDRELYLPQGWLNDPAPCHAAGVPAQRGFATKPELAG
jgi:hypothetical protein